MRRILVTGANKGIGQATVAAILDHAGDTFVFLGSRSKTRGEAAAAALVEGHPDWRARIEVVEIDVASDTSVSAAAAQVKPHGPLYAVVNNAGIHQAEADLEGVLRVNTLGVKHVCDAFVPMLDPKAGRVVNVTSASGPTFVNQCSDERKAQFTSRAIEWSDIEAIMQACIGQDAKTLEARGFGDGNAYGLSKACANSYTMLIARKHPKLHINACTPGFIETDMTRVFTEASGKSAKEMGMKSPAEGTKASMFLLFGQLEGNGNFYGSDAVRSPIDQYRAPGSPAYTGD